MRPLPTQPATANPAPVESAAAPVVHRVLTVEEVSKLTGLSPRTLRRMRAEGGGPVYVNLSAQRVGYLHRDITAWLEQQRQARSGQRARRRPMAQLGAVA